MSNLIVVTGGIGSGKSYIADLLAEKLKATTVDFDKVWHDKLGTDELKNKIVTKFGSVVLDDIDVERQIDRKRLGQIVFSSPEIMSEYMALIAPDLKEMEKDIFEYHIGNSHKYVILEIPVSFNYTPFESEYRKDALFVGVFASMATRIRRICMRSGQMIKDAEAERRIRFQPCPSQYMHLCDVAYWNDYMNVRSDDEIDAKKSLVKTIVGKFIDGV